jgi:hypothetical protein
LPDQVGIILEYGGKVWFRVERKVHIGNRRLGVIEDETEELPMLEIRPSHVCTNQRRCWTLFLTIPGLAVQTEIALRYAALFSFFEVR